MDKRSPLFLLRAAAGLGHSEWNADLKQFILGLRLVNLGDLARFKLAVEELFARYRRTYGMDFVLADLAEPGRIREKIKYVSSHYVGVRRDSFVRDFTADMLTPGHVAPHQAVVKDVNNWPADVLLEFYDLGSMQHITTALPRKFEALHSHSLRPYAYVNNLGQLISHLIAGVPVGQFFSSGSRFSEAKFYEAIWPLFTDCLWEALRGRKPLDPPTAETSHRYKKAMRIISSPDLEPISFLLRRSVPALSDGPTLRGAFNQLSTLRQWSRAALTTETTGMDAETGAIIQTQAVFGGKHISDKTRELAGRMRSLQLQCASDTTFVPEPDPGTHMLALDGDWPVTSKINLYEAGYTGIFEIAELGRLKDALAALPHQQGRQS